MAKQFAVLRGGKVATIARYWAILGTRALCVMRVYELCGGKSILKMNQRVPKKAQSESLTHSRLTCWKLVSLQECWCEFIENSETHVWEKTPLCGRKFWWRGGNFFGHWDRRRRRRRFLLLAFSRNDDMVRCTSIIRTRYTRKWQMTDNAKFVRH